MTSTERMLQYLEIPREKSTNITETSDLKALSFDSADHDTASGSSSRPAIGKIEFRNVYMQYRENPPVLSNVSFLIDGGQRVGVCGRTGAGKSR